MIDSKSCEDVIDGLSGLTDAEKKTMKQELPADNGFMCPDVKQLSVQGGVVKDEYRFELEVVRVGTDGPGAVTNQDPEQGLDTAFIISVLTRYFEAENYAENGYQDLISIDSDVVYPLADQTIIMRKQIAKTEIDFFNNRWWSIKDFKFIDAAQKLVNYHVEATSRRNLPRGDRLEYFRMEFN